MEASSRNIIAVVDLIIIVATYDLNEVIVDLSSSRTYLLKTELANL